jgi:GNAT superfamily N-acetyltransferase
VTIVRRALPGDAAAVAEVHVRTWQAAYREVLPLDRLDAVTVAQRVPLWERLLANPELSTFVAEQDDRIVAFVNVGSGREPDADGELYAIYALPDAWGTGAARDLMAAGLAALREAGHAGAVLWVLEDNPRARRFYEREGWTCDGGRKQEQFLGTELAEVRYAITL